MIPKSNLDSLDDVEPQAAWCLSAPLQYTIYNPLRLDVLNDTTSVPFVYVAARSLSLVARSTWQKTSSSFLGFSWVVAVQIQQGLQAFFGCGTCVFRVARQARVCWPRWPPRSTSAASSPWRASLNRRAPGHRGTSRVASRRAPSDAEPSAREKGHEGASDFRKIRRFPQEDMGRLGPHGL